MTGTAPNSTPPFSAAIQHVEIAICTFQRPELLRETLESIANCSLPDNLRVQVIIVNNALRTPDQTDKVCESFQSRLDLVIVHEPQTGHTFARNRAVEVAQGDLLIWTDDDVIVDENWILSYVAAANEYSNDSFWGGRIEPTFRPECPSWIEENWAKLKGCFAARDLGDQRIELSPDRLPYGANFALRTGVQKQFRFDTELGRRGEAVLGEDELDLFRRLLADGHRGGWVPYSKLQHLIPQDRATQEYVWNYFVGQGRALVAKRQAWHRNRARHLGTSIWNMLMWKFKRQFSESDVWVSHLICAALAEGQRQGLKR